MVEEGDFRVERKELYREDGVKRPPVVCKFVRHVGTQEGEGQEDVRRRKCCCADLGQGGDRQRRPPSNEHEIWLGQEWPL